MVKELLLGNEACAQGAIDAGITVAYGYPGTPSSEIIEYIMRKSEGSGVSAYWCTNEKTAFEAGLGVSFIGKRALVAMKHVGLNVAFDAFVNTSLQKINGGLVVAVADDPGMHSSQNEQDTRFLADFAKTVLFEPHNHQESYEMVIEAFEASERFHLPVIVRMVTRLSHSRSTVTTHEKISPVASLKCADGIAEHMCLPLYARENYRQLIRTQNELRGYSEKTAWNRMVTLQREADTGIITAGIGYNYYREIEKELPLSYSHFHIGVYPVPSARIMDFASDVKRLVIIEEGYPFIEQKLRSIVGDPVEIRGKMDGALPDQGELNPDCVRSCFGLDVASSSDGAEWQPPVRFSRLCKGCPHNDTFKVLQRVKSEYPDMIIMSDIGCYTLGALPPYELLDSAVCMGASIGMARGAVEGGGRHVMAVIGDSSLLHTGLQGLIDAVALNIPMVVFVLDNGTVAMTGGQKTVLSSEHLFSLLKNIGVPSDHVLRMVPTHENLEKNTILLTGELEYRGLSVVISARECVRTALKHEKGELV